MNKTFLVGLIGLVISPVAVADNADIRTEEVVVTASRVEQPLDTVLANVTVINRQEIQRAGQSTLVELLQLQPGIEINNNGGPGKTSGVFIRGTNTSHVVVLVDGMRIGSETSGLTAFENLPLAQIDRIEILRGPSSSLYGADAIGGVIQIFTKKGAGEPTFTASAGYGSYNTRAADAGVSGSIGDTSFALHASSYDTNGFSAYKTQNPQFKDKDGYRNLSISGSLWQKLAEGHNLGLQFFQSRGHVDYDNRFNFTDFRDNANLSQFSYSLTSKNQFTSNWLSTLRIGQGTDKSENFSEINIFTPISRSFFETKQRQYTWQNDVTLPLGTLTLLYDRLEQRVRATTDYDEDSRNNDGFLIGYLLNTGPHSLQVNYRSDHNNRYGDNDTGNVAYGYKLNQNWRISASHGTAFRAPTFNDLFYPAFFGVPSSNPDLKPEESRNTEAAVHYTDSDTAASITVYENEIDDLIALDANNNYLPFNINSAKIRGLTLAATQAFDAWQLKGSLDLQSPRDEDTDNLLVRRSNRHANISLSREWQNWRFGGEVVASSMRYNDAANTQRLAGYTLVNLTADYQLNQDWKLQTRLNNLFDKDYALALDGPFTYKTPRANLFVSIRYQPKN